MKKRPKPEISARFGPFCVYHSFIFTPSIDDGEDLDPV